MRPLHCDLHPLPLVTTSSVTILRHHPSSSLSHLFPQSPLPLITSSLSHHPSSCSHYTAICSHFPSSPLPSVTILRHHPSSSLPSTIMQPLHCDLLQPLPLVTFSLSHHPSSPPFAITSLNNHAAITLRSAATFLSHHFPQFSYHPSPPLCHHFPQSQPFVSFVYVIYCYVMYCYVM